jgi:hypothetical protein
MPPPLYTVTIPEGATLAYLFRVLCVGRTAEETVELLFKLYMRGEFRARGLPPNCRFIEENGALVVVDPDDKRFEPAAIKIFQRSLYDPHHPTFEEEPFAPSYAGLTPEETIEREERKAWEAWEREQEWKQEQREALEQAAREREAQDRAAQEREAWKAQEAEEQAVREAQDRAIMREAQEAQERFSPETRESQTSGKWAPILGSPVAMDDQRPSQPENVDSDPIVAADSEPNVVPFPPNEETRGRKEHEDWSKIEVFVKNTYPGGQPDYEVALPAVREFVRTTKLEIKDRTLTNGLLKRLNQWFR